MKACPKDNDPTKSSKTEVKKEVRKEVDLSLIVNFVGGINGLMDFALTISFNYSFVSLV